jgi:hypothetical protein
MLTEVVVFFYGLVDVPGAFEVFGEDYQIAWAEAYRILAISNRYLAFQQEAGFFFGVCPVEGAGFALPDRPGLAGRGLFFRWLFDDNILNSRHISFLLSTGGLESAGSILLSTPLDRRKRLYLTGSTTHNYTAGRIFLNGRDEFSWKVGGESHRFTVNYWPSYLTFRLEGIELWSRDN